MVLTEVAVVLALSASDGDDAARAAEVMLALVRPLLPTCWLPDVWQADLVQVCSVSVVCS
jgi:hypothetical protein